MKIFLTAALLSTTSTQSTPALYRAHSRALIPQEHAAANVVDSKALVIGEEFGRFDNILCP